MIKQQVNHFFEDSFLETATCAARRVDFLGRSFRVVPAVLVRAQVLRNNLGATFLPAEEITDDWAAQWNNIPVLVGPHPSAQGYASSGRTPELINERGVGWIFNARAENGPDGTRRLVGEVWLDESRASVVAGFQAVLERLDSGQPVELSTGFATQMDETTGVHNGQAYEMVLHPQGADHLVISVEMTGACSVLHGCGLGANEEAKVEDKDKQTTETGNDTPTQSVGGTAHPAGDFAYAPSGAPASDWKLPIFDADHVRAALARFNQTQLASNARAHVWRRVLAAADRLNVTVTDRTMPAHSTNPAAKLWAKVAELLGKTPEQAFSWEKHETVRLERELAASALTPSDDERRQMLKEALQEAFGASDREVIVCDVYTEPEKYVVFWFMTPMGPMPKGQEFYKIPWVDADNDGIPEITGQFMLVRRQTSYEQVGGGPAGDGAPASNKEVPAPAPVVEETAVNESGAHELVQAIERLKVANDRLGVLV